MKKIWITLMVLPIMCILHAQKKDSTHILQRVAPNDFHQYKTFTIKITPANLDGYGFDIITDRKNLSRHFQNPLPFSPKGIQKKEDAYKIAQWIINEFEKTGHWENMVPPHVLKELKIEMN